MKEPLLIILGPTAVGKTELSIAVAQELSGEIISADSMLIYRYMNIGTAKPTKKEQRGIPHHLIDIIDPNQPFSVADYCLWAEKAILEIRTRKNRPLLVGGTALYLKAFTEKYSFPELESNYQLRENLQKKAEQYGNEYVHEKLRRIDPTTAARLHPNDLRRVIRALEVYQLTGIPLSLQAKKEKQSSHHPISIGLTRPREEIYTRINYRVEQMIENGLVEEVENLLKKGYSPNLVAMQGLGYKQIIAYLQRQCTLEKAIEILKRDTRHFAKRQLTWFRREENIHWIDLSVNNSKKKLIEEIINFFQQKEQELLNLSRN